MGEYMRTLLNGLKAWVGGEIGKLRSKIEEVATAGAALAANNKAYIALLSEDMDGAYQEANAAQTTANEANTLANTALQTANGAVVQASSAKSAADNAQATAESAKTTAEGIKPNWEETNANSLSYISNRPFYEDLIMNRKSLIPVTTDTLIEGTQLYFGEEQKSSTSELPDLDGNVEAYVEVSTNKIFSPAWVSSPINGVYNAVGAAIGNLSLLKAKFPNLRAGRYGGELPDTGGEWVYYYYTPTTTVYGISKTQGQQIVLKELTKRELKLLDEKFIPASIQRVGEEIYLASSTPNSTKQFKVTVDDTGTISATEVTT